MSNRCGALISVVVCLCYGSPAQGQGPDEVLQNQITATGLRLAVLSTDVNAFVGQTSTPTAQFALEVRDQSDASHGIYANAIISLAVRTAPEDMVATDAALRALDYGIANTRLNVSNVDELLDIVERTQQFMPRALLVLADEIRAVLQEQLALIERAKVLISTR